MSAISARMSCDIVEQIPRILWFDFAREKWDRDKEWKVDTIENVSGVLDDHGLGVRQSLGTERRVKPCGLGVPGADGQRPTIF